MRYVAAELPAERYSAFRPGHFSAELREALGMDFSIMPPWVGQSLASSQFSWHERYCSYLPWNSLK